MSLTTPYFEQFLLADGRTTVFPFGKGFDALSPTFVKCQVFNTDGSVIVPDFTVDMATGSITIVSLTTPDGKVINAPLAGSIVRVYRDVPETQEITVASLKTSTAQQIVNMFNNIVAMIQELQYSDEHFTVRSTLPQRDLTFELLDEDAHKKLVYWDNDQRKLVVTKYPEDEIILSENVLRFKSQEGNLYYLDSDGWKLASPSMELILDEMQKVFYTKLQIDAKVNKLATKEQVDDLYKTKLDKNQGKENVGKVLTVEGDGIARPRVAQGGGSGLGVVAHDDTLFGAGTDEWPLGVKDKVTITIVDWE